MRKAIIRFFIKLYLKARKHWDPLLIPNKIREEFNCYSQDFSAKINSYPYRSDKLSGLIDNTADPNTFFDIKESDRDCDDFQRVWSWWGVLNGYKAKEFVICDPSSFRHALRTMHVIGTLEKDGMFYLTNYKIFGSFASENEALDYMKNYLYYKENMLVVFYREIKLEEGIIKDI